MPEEALQLPDPIIVEIQPHENGLAIKVKPRMEPEALSELLNKASGSLVLDDYMVISVMIPLDPENSQIILRTVGEREIHPVQLAGILRGLADGLTTEDIL